MLSMCEAPIYGPLRPYIALQIAMYCYVELRSVAEKKRVFAYVCDHGFEPSDTFACFPITNVGQVKVARSRETSRPELPEESVVQASGTSKWWSVTSSGVLVAQLK
jgi:hypothetical protein